MKPPQQIFEHEIGIILMRRASREGAAKRGGDSGLVGQAFDMDDSPVHVMPGRLLRFNFDGHCAD